MPVPLEAQAQVYWRTSLELRDARKHADHVAEAEALYELLDLRAFSKNELIRRRCGVRSPAGAIGRLRRQTS